MIHGLGLFATQPLPEGTIVSRLGGRLVSEAELRRVFAESSSYVDTITVGDDLHLVLPPNTPSGRANHSCDPNLWWIDTVTLAARRDIKAGEELTNDYGTCSGIDDFAMACACGSPLCRGTITGRDWQLPELRARYGDHWIPALRARMV